MRKQKRRARLPETPVNHRIRASEIRLIDADGNQIGVMHPKKALAIAQEKGLDLVEVVSDSKPPVCRILDYGKYKYEQSKREKAKKRSDKMVTKEIKFRPSTAEHDYQFKKRHAEKFLLSGSKTILTMRFRGRQIAHPELASNMLKRMAGELSEISEILSPPKMQERTMSMVLAPKSP